LTARNDGTTNTAPTRIMIKETKSVERNKKPTAEPKVLLGSDP
jgi:hypothetical protein